MNQHEMNGLGSTDRQASFGLGLLNANKCEFFYFAVTSYLKDLVECRFKPIWIQTFF